MTDLHWDFDKQSKRGSTYGHAISDALKISKHASHGENLLAREALQNSCDAQNNKNKKISIKIRKVKLTGTYKAKFIDDLQLNEIGKRKEAVAALTSGTIFDLNSDEEGELNLIFIEDFNTHGLYGSMDGDDFMKSCLFKLLIQQNDPDKNENDEGSGGSYGVGKAALSINSNIRTIAVYSNFNDKYIAEHHKNKTSYVRKDGVTKVFMASTYLTKHDIENNHYTGMGHFHQKSEKDSEEINPFYNEMASDFAKKLFFSPRSEEDIGTSVMLIDSNINIDKCRKAIEDYWWPKLIDNELEIELSEGENEYISRVDPPRPKIRASLKPFITAYEKTQGIQNAEADVIDQAKFEKDNISINKPGKTAVVAISPEDSISFFEDESSLEDEDEDEDYSNKESTKINKIALIRKPKMVIDYLTATSTNFGEIYAIGVYKSNEKEKWADTFLKYSENQAHEKWDDKEVRLNELKYEDGAAITCGAAFVKATVNHIKSALSRYLKNLSKKNKPKPNFKNTKLEKMLGNLFKPETKGPNNPIEPSSRPVSINYYNSPTTSVTSNELIQLHTIIDIAAAKHNKEEYIEIHLGPTVECIGSEGEKVGLPVKIMDIKLDPDCKDIDFATHKDAKGNLYASLTLNKKSKARVEIRSAPYDKLYEVEFNPNITYVENSKTKIKNL
ncbi:hypothetical protein N9410_00890 [Methylophilaceae bacterium]|nr:hypothetical protein [Methylophilaceae bacterium]